MNASFDRLCRCIEGRIAAANGQSSGGPWRIGADERATIVWYFSDGPGDGIPRVDGFMFSQDAASRRAGMSQRRPSLWGDEMILIRGLLGMAINHPNFGVQ